MDNKGTYPSWWLLGTDREVREAIGRIFDENNDSFKSELAMASFRIKILDTVYLIFDKVHREMLQEHDEMLQAK